MNCPSCNKKLKGGERTDSQVCAGKLAYSWRIANKLRKDFNNKDKNKVREDLFNKFIKNQFQLVKNHGFLILDFWGGGLFSDYILDHTMIMKNYSKSVLYEIDENQKLAPALKDYANRKNFAHIVKNHDSDINHPDHVRNQEHLINHNRHMKNQMIIVPFCGSLAKFINKHTIDMKNHHYFDFIWLDYCGTLMNLRDDLEILTKIVGNNTTIAITIFKQRDHMIDQDNRRFGIDIMIKKYFPFHKRVYTKAYGNKGAMEVYVFKIPGYIKKVLPLWQYEKLDSFC